MAFFYIFPSMNWIFFFKWKNADNYDVWLEPIADYRNEPIAISGYDTWINEAKEWTNSKLPDTDIATNTIV